jgi:hypothetical protein
LACIRKKSAARRQGGADRTRSLDFNRLPSGKRPLAILGTVESSGSSTQKSDSASGPSFVAVAPAGADGGSFSPRRLQRRRYATFRPGAGSAGKSRRTHRALRSGQQLRMAVCSGTECPAASSRLKTQWGATAPCGKGTPPVTIRRPETPAVSQTTRRKERGPVILHPLFKTRLSPRRQSSPPAEPVDYF